MIFVSVGTQLPFDRMVRCMDAWAAQNTGVEVFGQIGPGSYFPKHFKAVDFISPADIDMNFQRAELVVAHAGMGTILSCLLLRKPLIIVPRRQALGEHRSDHQMTTAKWLNDDLHLNTAFSTDELTMLLNQRDRLRTSAEIGESAQIRLIETIRKIVDAQQRSPTIHTGIADWTTGFRKLLSERRMRANRHG